MTHDVGMKTTKATTQRSTTRAEHKKRREVKAEGTDLCLVDGDRLDHALLGLREHEHDVEAQTHRGGEGGRTSSAMARRATDMLTLRRSLMMEAEIIWEEHYITDGLQHDMRGEARCNDAETRAHLGLGDLLLHLLVAFGLEENSVVQLLLNLALGPFLLLAPAARLCKLPSF